MNPTEGQEFNRVWKQKMPQSVGAFLFFDFLNNKNAALSDEQCGDVDKLLVFVDNYYL